MDEYTNELVVRKKKYAYIFLIIVFVASVVLSDLYFSSLEAMTNNYSGEILESGEYIYSGEDIEVTIQDFINNNDVILDNIVVDDKSGEIIQDIIVSDIENNEVIEDEEKVIDYIEENEEINYEITSRALDPNKPMVALTFDDGPDPKRTIKLLEILKKHDVLATFFDIGSLMEKYPEIVKKEVEAGCDVGGHTYSHVNLNSLSQSQAKEEILKVKSAFKSATGLELKYLRPTYGNANSSVRAIAGIPIINWCIDSLDWKYRDADKVIEEIRKTKNFDGRIILMHVIYDSTLEAVDRLIPQLKSEGYQVVTISEMAKYKGFNLENGKIYYQFIK